MEAKETDPVNVTRNGEMEGIRWTDARAEGGGKGGRE